MKNRFRRKILGRLGASVVVVSLMFATITGMAGTASAVQSFNNAGVADAGLAELGTSRPTGWNQPGECIKSVQRWVAAAGGSFGGGGVISGYTSSGAQEVSLASAVKGDVIQYTNANGNDQDWSHVHTMVVINNLGNGHFDIVQSNSPAGSGLVSRRNNMVPSPASGWVSRVWRFGTVMGGSGPVANGSYVLASDTGNVYVMAGGAAMYVSSWSNVGGPQTINATRTQAQINTMPQYSADGTAIRDAIGGGIWIVAGGFAFAVSNLGHTPGISWVNIDVNALAYLRSEPMDGTVVRDEAGGIYVVSGGAAMAVSSLANIPYTSWANVDSWSIAHQMRQYPKDGTTFVDYSTGTVYVVAGEAPLAVTSFNNIPPVSSLAYIDHWVLQNQLRQYPKDGTVIRDYVGGGVYVVAGGSALGVASMGNVPYSSWVNVDNWSVGNQLLAYPADNTYVQGYGTGQLFKVLGGMTTRVTSAPSSPTVIDDWAVDNHLHATR